jgi:hypothetical protein
MEGCSQRCSHGGDRVTEKKQLNRARVAVERCPDLLRVPDYRPAPPTGYHWCNDVSCSGLSTGTGVRLPVTPVSDATGCSVRTGNVFHALFQTIVRDRCGDVFRTSGSVPDYRDHPDGPAHITRSHTNGFSLSLVFDGWFRIIIW